MKKSHPLLPPLQTSHSLKGEAESHHQPHDSNSGQQESPSASRWKDLGERSTSTLRRVDLTRLQYQDPRDKTVKIRAEEFNFVGCCAHNRHFDRRRGDNEARVYVPIQNKQSHLYVCHVNIATKENPVAQLEAQINVLVPDIKGIQKQESRLNCFGAALSDDGILWLALHNVNCISGYDLAHHYVKYQFNGIPSPKDIVINSAERVLYVASGISLNHQTPTNQVRSPRHPQLHKADDSVSDLVIPTRGTIRELRLKLPRVAAPFPASPSRVTTILSSVDCVREIKIQSRGEQNDEDAADPSRGNDAANQPHSEQTPGTLASLALTKDGRLFYSGLLDLHVFLPPHAGIVTPSGQFGHSVKHTMLSSCGTENSTLWNGTLVGDGSDCYFLDSINMWSLNEHSETSTEVVVGSIYRKSSIENALLIRSPLVDDVGWALAKGLNCMFSGFSNVFTSMGITHGRLSHLDSINNAAMPHWYSTQEEAQDLLFAAFDNSTRSAHHFRIIDINGKILENELRCSNNASYEAEQRELFDGHVTHVSVHADTFIFINFTTGYLLLMDDHDIKDTILQSRFCNNQHSSSSPGIPFRADRIELM
jgi:hypothetical protein